MDVKRKIRIKIRVKAGIGIFADFIALYTLGGVVATGLHAKENTLKEIDSSVHELILETDNVMLENISNKLVRAIKVDAYDINNMLDILDNCPNLKYIEIFNAQRLTDEAISKINEKGIKEVNLVFNKEDVLRLISDNTINRRFDLDRFYDKNIINNISFSSSDGKEIDNFLLMNYLTNYENLSFDFLNYKYLDDIIEEMIKELNLNYSNPEDVLNLIKIVNKERLYLQYDTDVLEKTITDTKELYYKDRKLYKLIEEYCYKSISSVLDQNELSIDNNTQQVKAICANYMDLFMMFCIKSNIECYSVEGLHSDISHQPTPHGWNMIKLQGNYYLVDVTRFDSFDETNELMTRFMETNDIETYYAMLNDLVIPIDSELGKQYDSYINLDIIKRGELVEPVHDKIYGTEEEKVFHKMGFRVASLFLIAGIFVTIYNEYVNRYNKQINHRL